MICALRAGFDVARELTPTATDGLPNRARRQAVGQRGFFQRLRIDRNRPTAEYDGVRQQVAIQGKEPGARRAFDGQQAQEERAAVFIEPDVAALARHGRRAQSHGNNPPF